MQFKLLNANRLRRLLSSPPNRDVTFAHSSSIAVSPPEHISRLISLGNYLSAALESVFFISCCLFRFYVLHPWCFGLILQQQDMLQEH